MRNARKTRSPTRRRLMLIGGIGAIGAGMATLLPARLDDVQPVTIRRHRRSNAAEARVPPTIVSLADYGGVPGAGRAALVRAFGRAFASLAAAGGGTLFVPAGRYDFGQLERGDDVILCRDAHDIAISAYGAFFSAQTMARVVPHLFYFFNFHNITIAGARFSDTGFDPHVNWKGMYCVGIQADRASSGFRMLDCSAERVMGLLASNNNARSRMVLSDISVDGEVRHSYYGVGASYIREKVRVRLVCYNVRRAFIAYSLNDADILVSAHNTINWPGSNGLVALVSGGASMGNVEKVRVDVEVSGAGIHGSYVHFYHQGPEANGYMRDIDATVNLRHVRSAHNLFVFDHEIDGVQTKTARIWDRIFLHGSVIGAFEGSVVSNTSVTTSPGTVYLDPALVKVGNNKTLAAGFRVRLP